MKGELEIKVYTDGACSGNPGAGGWAALLLIKGKNGKEAVTIKGGEKHSTNNRMELLAVIEALIFIHKNLPDYEKDVVIHSDSSYVVNSITSGSLKRWMGNGWKTTKGTDVVNQDLWLQVVEYGSKLEPSYIKVKGHSDNKFNNYVDEVAVQECAKYKQLLEAL